jgi:hypothetical protein
MEPIYELGRYVSEHTVRGTCRCGKCADHPGVDSQPTGHTADVFFFEVSATGEPTAEELRRLVESARQGEFAECDPFDGNEHSYIELGGWIGAQGLAMQFMGLCAVLGLADVLTPKMLPGLPDDLMAMMAGSGMVSMKSANVMQPA